MLFWNYYGIEFRHVPLIVLLLLLMHLLLLLLLLHMQAPLSLYVSVALLSLHSA